MQQPPVASEKILKSSAVISDKPTAILGDFYYSIAIKVTLQHSWLFTDGFSRSVYHFSFTNLGLLQSSFDCQLLCFFRVILAFSTYREQQ